VSKFSKSENYLFKTKSNKKMNTKNMQLIQKGVNKKNVIICQNFFVVMLISSFMDH